VEKAEIGTIRDKQRTTGEENNKGMKGGHYEATIDMYSESTPCAFKAFIDRSL